MSGQMCSCDSEIGICIVFLAGYLTALLNIFSNRSLLKQQFSVSIYKVIFAKDWLKKQGFQKLKAHFV